MVILRSGLVNAETQPTAAAATQDESVAFFEAKVRPILEAACWKCHGPEKQRGGLRLDHPELILRGGDLGPAVSLDDPTDSQLLRAIRFEDLEMPPSGRLPEEQIAVLSKWVELGLPWTPGVPVPETGDEEHEVAHADAGDHWAYQPIASVVAPPVEETDWARNPIDLFIKSRLEQAGIPANPPADRRAWLRRVYYNMIGLPPTPAEVQAFEQDMSPQAYERVVDDLLARPGYGEKWGRHWLDLVRYAETNGYERDGPKANAWRYRDYVIAALNDDKPYDRFALEQLAGDELPDRTRESIIATGYHRLGIWDDEPADADQAYYDSLDDVLSTTSTVFLATTVGCARCHDHKIDPIPQRDYYQMLAFFHNTYNNIQQHEFKKSAFTLNTQVPIPTPEERRDHERQREQHREQIDALERERKALEEEVVETFSNAEREDAQDARVREHMIQQRFETALTAEKAARYRRLKREQERARRDRVPPLPHALAIQENGRSAPPTHILIRGNAHALGEEVEPGYLTILATQVPSPEVTGLADDIHSSGRRLAFARWMVDENHPLTARVIVNRVWQYHFGRGLVRSTSDFGKSGDQPTHPELLDYLAQELMRHDWQLKWLHRMILTSTTYRMSSEDQPEGLERDPINDLFWRVDMRRLTAEEVRDTLLFATGQLNRQMGGPSVYSELPDVVLQTASRPDAAWGNSPPSDQVRRSVYVFVKRSINDPIMIGFDAADKDSSCPVRFTTTVPTQSLTTLNGQFFNKQAVLLAKQILANSGDTTSDHVRRAILATLGREPTNAELDRGTALIEQWQSEDGATQEDAMRYFCLLCLNLNELVYLD